MTAGSCDSGHWKVKAVVAVEPVGNRQQASSSYAVVVQWSERLILNQVTGVQFPATVLVVSR